MKLFSRRNLKKVLFAFALVLGFSVHANAQMSQPLPHDLQPKEVHSLDAFAALPVLEDGRIKPLDTFSRNLLLRFSGKRTFDKKPALRWLARLIFAPQQTHNDQIFLINNPELPMALGIEADSGRRYSFAQLEPGLGKLEDLAQKASGIERKSRSIVEEEIIRLKDNVQLYMQLSQSLLFTFPHPDFSPEEINVVRILDLPPEQHQFSFLDIALKADLIQRATQTLEQKPQNTWTRSEADVVRLMASLFQWSSSYHHIPLQIIPGYAKGSEDWYSPWDIMQESFKSEEGRKELGLLRDMTVNYWNGDQIQFDLSVRAFSDAIRQRGGKSVVKGMGHIPLELFYNQTNLFSWARLLYGFAFVFFLFSLFSSKNFLYRGAGSLVVIGFLMEAFSLAMRMSILTRPPVTNLYETFIFVSFIAVLVGIILERVNKNWLGIVIASVSGLIFLMIADKFSAEGDTLKMLVAVLNSNFWLGTHVLSITTGYAGVCVAGILGHVYILQGLFKSKEKKLLETTYKNIMGVLGFGLTMTFLGTNLGGIWADQSWGRFWGWDPKENGAMLIVLWCAILFHARIAKMIGPLGIAVGSILGIIVVTWAWFGVNLLSVGLHSYGFTSGAAFGLGAYVLGQLLFITVTVPLVKKRVG